MVSEKLLWRAPPILQLLLRCLSSEENVLSNRTVFSANIFCHSDPITILIERFIRPFNLI